MSISYQTSDLGLAWEKYIQVLAELHNLIESFRGDLYTEKQINDLLKQGLFWAKIVQEEREK